MRLLPHAWWRLRQPNPTPRDFIMLGMFFGLGVISALIFEKVIEVSIFGVIAAFCLALFINDAREFLRTKEYRRLRKALMAEFAKRLSDSSTLLRVPDGQISLNSSHRGMVQCFHLSQGDFQEARNAGVRQAPVSCFGFDWHQSKVFRVTALFDIGTDGAEIAVSVNTYSEEWQIAYEKGLLDASAEDLQHLLAMVCEGVPAGEVSDHDSGLN